MKNKHVCRFSFLVLMIATVALGQFEDKPGANKGGPSAGPGGAQRGGPQWRPGGGHGFGSEQLIGRILNDGNLAKEAGLSEEQIATIKKELNGLKQRSIELRAQLELAGLEQAEIMTAEEMDEDALMAAVERTGKIHTEMAKLRISHLLVIKKNISPAQLTKVRETLHAKMKDHFRDRREGGHGGWRENSGDYRRRSQHRPNEDKRPPEAPESQDERL